MYFHRHWPGGACSCILHIIRSAPQAIRRWHPSNVDEITRLEPTEDFRHPGVGQASMGLSLQMDIRAGVDRHWSVSHWTDCMTVKAGNCTYFSGSKQIFTFTAKEIISFKINSILYSAFCYYLHQLTNSLYFYFIQERRLRRRGKGDMSPNIPTGGTTCFMSPTQKITEKSMIWCAYKTCAS